MAAVLFIVWENPPGWLLLTLLIIGFLMILWWVIPLLHHAFKPQDPPQQDEAAFKGRGESTIELEDTLVEGYSSLADLDEKSRFKAKKGDFKR